METTFKKSESITALAKALIDFQKKVKPIKRDGENPHFKSRFATLENIIEGISEPLQEAKLSYVQMPSGENLLVTVLMHESGEWMESTVKMAPKENTPQGQGSAITYMRRYSLSAMLGLATEDDDDGNEATDPSKKPPRVFGGKSAAGKKEANPLFEKAKKNLSANTDPKQLKDFRVKIEGSDKYNAEEKAELFAIIDKNLAAAAKKGGKK